MKDAQPKAIFLKDYVKPDYQIEKTDLAFDLEEDYTVVTSKLEVRRSAHASADAPLVLNGQEMELLSVKVDGRALAASEFVVDSESLTIEKLPAESQIQCVTKIEPHANTSLEGLYKSRAMFCTQCEAEGFRKITYYLDRPDVMSEFTTQITADKTRYPILLSNGNKVDAGELEGNKHWVKWHDPFKKPCYLFALVAGDLVSVDDTFKTLSGRDVAIRVFVEEKDTDKCQHAITSLKNAMKWDEDVYGREYDLDIFMIVAVDDFNMGAMENKGLNIFNTSCVLAKPETTTDDGFQRVEGVVAHEYFHNWSGNRVTCRDWFQLSLKEGFTVFRDAEFSADMGSRTVKRVEDVSFLKTMQFAEDAGPMSHPVQPSSYIEISNFYTLTIYEKGSEVVRMIRTLLGEELFRSGSDLYFDQQDGSAATIEDFVSAMAEVSGRDFSQFMRWYRVAGTPEIHAVGEYDAENKQYHLSFSQPKSISEQGDEPFVVPISMGLLGSDGPLALTLAGEEQKPEGVTSRVLEFNQMQQRFSFENIEQAPVPSLLRGFSAPIKLHYNYSRDDLMRLMSADEDGFVRWDASQQLAVQVIEEVMAALVNEPAPNVDARLIEAYKTILQDHSLDPAMVALMLKLPSEAYLAELKSNIDVEAIHHARNRVERRVAVALHEQFVATYERFNDNEPFSVSSDAIAKRALKNTALHYLMVLGKEESQKLCYEQWKSASNMTDELAALTAIVHSPKASLADVKAQVLLTFYDKWKDEALVLNHWLAAQCTSPVPGTLAKVEELMQHEAFDIKNPNKIRSVIGAFAMRNPTNFHDKSGNGYRFLADQIIALDDTNPQVAARLLTPLTKWKKYDQGRQDVMKAQLKRILAKDSVSKDVYEVVDKSLTH